MALFVLVHGGSVTGKVWDPVVSILKSRGHRVFAPTLSDENTSSLSDHIAQICRIIEDESLQEVILTGHSYGGLVIAGTADRLKDRIRRLIFLDTCLPENGKSLFDLIKDAGQDPLSFKGLEPLKPYVEPLFFSEELFRKKEKLYVHCLKSVFLPITEYVSRKILNDTAGNWQYRTADTGHSLMTENPELTGEILMSE